MNRFTLLRNHPQKKTVFLFTYYGGKGIFFATLQDEKEDANIAIFYCSVKTIGRNSGRSAVGTSADRSGEKITNEYDGLIHDYRNKSGVVYSEILLP